MKTSRYGKDLAIKHLTICLTALLAVGLVSLPLEAEDKTQAAVAAAQQWLQLVDQGDYKQSWKTAASYFQMAIDQEPWGKALRTTRRPLGRVIKRQLEGAQFFTSLPGAPDGEYVVIQYRTQFANKAQSVETITPMKDKDGQWRVSGYYIK